MNSIASLYDLGRRLQNNVVHEQSDQGPAIMEIAVADYQDPVRFDRELELLFRQSPLLVALSCDVPNPGDYTTLDIAKRPIIVVRGADGVARTFLNACRHRGAPVASADFGHPRRLTCPYHSWVYDTDGTLVGITDRTAFEGIDVHGLVEYPTTERAGAVFAVLHPGDALEVDEWLDEMAAGLETLQLDKLHRHDVETKLPSGNWKATADGYVDGYHLGYLHRASIGAKSITNRNTYDLWGPHVRIGFANKLLLELGDTPVEEWDMYAAFSLVHFIFPNVSISGHPTTSLMVSRIHPGPNVHESTVVQYQYFREPLVTEEARAEAEAKRQRYEAVTYEEDFMTVMAIGRRLDALAGDVFRFGRNERGNQNFHTWTQRLAGSEIQSLP